MGLQVRVSFVLPSAVNVCCCRLRPRPPCIPRYNTAHRHSPHYIYSLSSLSAGWALCCTKKGPPPRGISPPRHARYSERNDSEAGEGGIAGSSPIPLYNIQPRKKRGGEKKSWEICRRRSSDVAGEREWWEGEKKEGELVPLPCPSCFSPFFGRRRERERKEERESCSFLRFWKPPQSVSRPPPVGSDAGGRHRRILPAKKK